MNRVEVRKFVGVTGSTTWQLPDDSDIRALAYDKPREYWATAVSSPSIAVFTALARLT